MRRLSIAACALVLAAPLQAQDEPQISTEVELPAGVTSQMVTAGEISMEIWRSGDDGLPVVWVQDMHNYFTAQGDPQYSSRFLAMSGPQREFLARLGEEFRAYAPMRRGYGKTEDDGAYDIPSHGRALISMLDAEGIGKAVFLGRTPTQLDLLWLAENHPDRMAGVIFLEGTPQVMLDAEDPDLFALGSGFWRSSLDISSDIEKIDAITVGRLASYIPEFLSDPAVRIEVPALYLEGPPPTEGQWMWLAIFRGIGSQVQCSETAKTFPCNVFGDPDRVARLEVKLTEHPMNELAAQARGMMEARFADFRVDAFQMPSGPPSPDTMWRDYLNRIQPFLRAVSDRRE